MWLSMIMILKGVDMTIVNCGDEINEFEVICDEEIPGMCREVKV